MFWIGAISAKLRLIFCRCLFVIAPIFFIFSTAQAETIPATRLVAYSEPGYCTVTFTYNGVESGLSSAFSAQWLSANCAVNYGSGALQLSSYIVPSNLQLCYLWSSSTVPICNFYSVTGYSCPSNYTLNGTNCDSVGAPPTTCPTGYVLQAGVCVASGSGTAALTPEQLSALNWLIANQSSLSASVGVFDPINGAGFFAFGFAGVLLLFFSSHIIGLVLKQVKNG